MAAVEVKILRDELARTHGKVSRLEAQMARMAEEFARAGEAGQRRIAELAAENDEYKRRLAYENSNRPSSSDSLKGDKRQRERRAARGKKRPAGKRGGRKGHRGASKTRKADRTVHHRVEKCGGCGGTDLEDDGSHTKIVEDVPEIVKAEVTAHVVHGARCNGCGARTRAGDRRHVAGPQRAAHLRRLVGGAREPEVRGVVPEDIRHRHYKVRHQLRHCRHCGEDGARGRGGARKGEEIRHGPG